MPTGMSYSGATVSPHIYSATEPSDGALSDADASSSSAMGAAAASSSSALAPHLEGAPLVLTKKRLQDLVKEIDPMEVLDEDVEEVLLQVRLVFWCACVCVFVCVCLFVCVCVCVCVRMCKLFVCVYLF